MSIPSGDKVLGETGHLQDHNDITDVLRDHEERITEVEGASLGIADVSGLQAALDAKAPTEAPTLVGPVEITGDIGSTIFSGDDFLMDVASDNPVAGPGMSMTKRREAAAALEVGDAVGYIGYMKGSDSEGDPTLGLQLHVEVDDTVDAGVVPMALVLSQQKADGTFEETHRWNSDGTTTPSSGGGGGVDLADRRWIPESDNAANDEFRDGSIDVAWTRVDASGQSGYASIIEGGDSLSLKTSLGSDGAGPSLHALMKPYALAVGEYIQTHIKSAGIVSNYPTVGLIVADGNTHGAGNQHVAMYIPAGSFYGFSHAAFTGYNSRTAGFVDSTADGRLNEFHLRLHRDTSDVWRMSTSPDGVQWAEVSTHTHALTPTHVGLYCSGWGSAVQYVFCCDYFRVGTA